MTSKCELDNGSNICYYRCVDKDNNTCTCLTDPQNCICQHTRWHKCVCNQHSTDKCRFMFNPGFFCQIGTNGQNICYKVHRRIIDHKCSCKKDPKKCLCKHAYLHKCINKCSSDNDICKHYHHNCINCRDTPGFVLNNCEIYETQKSCIIC